MGRKKSSRILLLLLAMVLPWTGHAQQVNLDSLIAIWTSRNQSDTVRLNAVHEACWNLMYSDPDSCRQLALSSLSFAQSKDQKSYQGDALNIIGTVYRLTSTPKQALEYYKRALKMRRALKDEAAVAASLNNIGNAYLDLGQYADAQEYYSECLKTSKKIGFTAGVGSSLLSLSTIHRVRGDFESAIECLTEALALSEASGNKLNAAACLGNIGNIYFEQHEYEKALRYHRLSLAIADSMSAFQDVAQSLGNLGNIYKDLGENDSALYYYRKSQEVFQELGDLMGVAASFTNIGSIHASKKEYQEAIELIAKSVELRERIADTLGLANALNNMGRVYREVGNAPMAKEYYNQALSISRRVGSLVEAKGALDGLYQVNRDSRNFREALEAFEQFLVLQDSMGSAEGQKAIVKQMLLYDFKKKVVADSLAQEVAVSALAAEGAIARLQAQKQRGISVATMSVSTLLLLGGALVFYLDRKRRKHRYARRAAHLQTQVFRSQVNPQFIHTALQNINDYVQANERDLASSFLTRFARLMRAVLENARKDEVSLASDLAVMQDYLELEKVRMKDGFAYTIEVDPAVDSAEVMVPPMLLQPFAEEAIWKRLAHGENVGHLFIRVQAKGNALILSLEDDGKAAAVTQNAARPTDDVDGTAITRSRLELLAKQEGGAASVQIIPLARGQRVELTLPLQNAA